MYYILYILKADPSKMLATAEELKQKGNDCVAIKNYKEANKHYSQVH
jgi:hypothetical protein